MDRAIELNPNSATAHHWKGVYLSIRGHLDEAKVEMHRALELDPLSLVVMTDIGQLHYFAHEYDQASDYCNRALSIDPEFHDAHTYLIDIYRMRGMEREAANEMIQANRSGSADAQRQAKILAGQGIGSLIRSNLNEILMQLSHLPADSDSRSLWALMAARAYCRLGDSEQAIRWLAVAVEKPAAFWTPYIGIDPLYDPLRKDPRFKDILNHLRLAPT